MPERVRTARSCSLVEPFAAGLCPLGWRCGWPNRRSLLDLQQQDLDAGRAVRQAAGVGRASGEGSVLRRAMEAPDAAAVFAEAADRQETDPLTDPDVRLWVGLLPLS